MPSESRRFAPSPTGYLTLAGLAHCAVQLAVCAASRRTIRVTHRDTDIKRNTEEAMAAIYEGLEWLGLNWDEGRTPAAI